MNLHRVDINHCSQVLLLKVMMYFILVPPQLSCQVLKNKHIISVSTSVRCVIKVFLEFECLCMTCSQHGHTTLLLGICSWAYIIACWLISKYSTQSNFNSNLTFQTFRGSYFNINGSIASQSNHSEKLHKLPTSNLSTLITWLCHEKPHDGTRRALFFKKIHPPSHNIKPQSKTSPITPFKMKCLERESYPPQIASLHHHHFPR